MNFVILILIIGHSLISFLCFSLNYQFYKKFYSRCMVYFSSMVLSNPMISLMMITVLVMNFSFPGVVSFWGEIFSFSNLLSLGSMMITMILVLIFFIMLYTINIMSSSVNNSMKNNFILNLSNYSLINYFMLAFMSMPTMIMFLLF